MDKQTIIESNQNISLPFVHKIVWIISLLYILNNSTQFKYKVCIGSFGRYQTFIACIKYQWVIILIKVLLPKKTLLNLLYTVQWRFSTMHNSGWAWLFRNWIRTKVFCVKLIKNFCSVLMIWSLMTGTCLVHVKW